MFFKISVPFLYLYKEKRPSPAGDHAACEVYGAAAPSLTNLGSGTGHTHQQPGALRSLAIRWENLLFPCDSLELILRRHS